MKQHQAKSLPVQPGHVNCSDTVKTDSYTLTPMHYIDFLPKQALLDNELKTYCEAMRKKNCHALAEKLVDEGIGKVHMEYNIERQGYDVSCSFIVGEPN